MEISYYWNILSNEDNRKCYLKLCKEYKDVKKEDNFEYNFINLIDKM